jgi:hypothetical protein
MPVGRADPEAALHERHDARALSDGNALDQPDRPAALLRLSNVDLDVHGL